MKSENYLKELQDQLKKEWLLLEREQREKNKIKKEIDEKINNYFEIWVESQNNGKITNDDGFGNCYNFVKDVVLTICKDVTLGFKILALGDEKFTNDMIGVYLNILYENFCQSDPYSKNITKFIILVIREIIQYIELAYKTSQSPRKSYGIDTREVPKFLWEILKQFFLKDENRSYFQMKSNKVLSMVPVLLHNINNSINNFHDRSGVQSSLIELEELNTRETRQPMKSVGLQLIDKSFLGVLEEEIDKKITQIANDFATDIIENAGLFPIGIKIILHTFRKELKQRGYDIKKIDAFLWNLLLPEYLRPLTNSDKRKWNHFRNSHFSEALERICKEAQSSFNETNIKKIIEKGSALNVHQYEEIFTKTVETNNKITVYGACLTFRQLELFVRTIKYNEKQLKKISERAVNRANRILEINPELFIFTEVQNPTTTYLIFKELSYGTIIEKDYFKIYNSTYKEDKVKNILLQILTDNDFRLPDYYRPGFHSLKEIFEKIAENQELHVQGSTCLGYSSEFIMKLKFLIWLLQKEQIEQDTMFSSMISECKERQQDFIKLFEKTKFQMLRTLTHINKIKDANKKRRQNEEQIESHLKSVKILDQMKVNFCITSPSTRSDKFKYLRSGSDQIICESAQTCIHQDNIITGLKNHANSLWETIEIFASLKEVKEAIEMGKDKVDILSSLMKIFQFIEKQFRTTYHQSSMKEFNQFEKSLTMVFLRAFHEILLERAEPSQQDKEFYLKTKNLSFIQPKNIRLTSQKNLSDFQQLWQITNRYIDDFSVKKTPIQKVSMLNQLFYIVNVAIEANLNSIINVANYLQIIIAYCLIKAKPKKFISNINFILTFLPRDKLVSREGQTLNKIKRSVVLVQNDSIVKYLAEIDENEYNEQFNRISIGQDINTMKIKQKQQGLIPYL